MENFILKENKIKSKENTLSLILWNIINSINRLMLNNNKIIIDIRELIQYFKKKHPTYRGSIQNDAQEFCRVFLEDISLESNEIENIPEYYELPYQYETDKLKLSEIYYNNNIERENSIITRIFYSQIISTYTCDCNNILYAFQNIMDIPLLLPDKTEYINLYDSLKLYFNQEKIKMEAPCNKCKESNKMNTKVIKISKHPKILIFSIQRILPYTNTKNDCYVNFPDTLDITDFIDEDLGKKYNSFNKSGKCTFNLYSVVNHFGSLEFGHYNCFIKLKLNNFWYEFNDSSTNLIGETLIDKSHAYCLYYMKE